MLSKITFQNELSFKTRSFFAPRSNTLLTRNYYHPTFPRDPKYAKVTEDDKKFFKEILGETGVISGDPQSLEAYNTDWMRKFRGQSSVVLRPKTTEQVSKILKYCNQKRLAVVPQGGNTGLVGGSVPVFDEIVLSTQLMNKIVAMDKVSGIVTCQAGVVLGALETYLADFGCTVPLDLGAKGSCQIGGNVATNAGGVRLVRYGSLHGNVLGLEVVLADGTIVDSLSTLRKDNTGYDVKQLFIGSEGTLGVITTVSLLTPPKPTSVHVAFFGVESFDHVKKVYVEAKKELGEILSAVEFVDRRSVDMVLKHQAKARDPFQSVHPFYVLIETSGTNEAHDREKLDSFLTKLMNDSNVINDGTVADQDTQIQGLWMLRERVSESLQRNGVVYKYDISLPLDYFYKLVEDTRQRIGDRGTVVGYGHVGDCNLHLNISTPEFSQETFDLIEPYVFEWTAKYRGSISAEHGLGLTKGEYLHCSKTQPVIDVMRLFKKTLDPNGILNPYKVIPRQPANVSAASNEIRD